MVRWQERENLGRGLPDRTAVIMGAVGGIRAVEPLYVQIPDAGGAGRRRNRPAGPLRFAFVERVSRRLVPGITIILPRARAEAADGCPSDVGAGSDIRLT